MPCWSGWATSMVSRERWVPRSRTTTYGAASLEPATSSSSGSPGSGSRSATAGSTRNSRAVSSVPPSASRAADGGGGEGRGSGRVLVVTRPHLHPVLLGHGAAAGGDLGQFGEVVLPRRPGCAQHDQRGRGVGGVPEAVRDAGR